MRICFDANTTPNSNNIDNTNYNEHVLIPNRVSARPTPKSGVEFV